MPEAAMVLALTTEADAERAESLARHLLESRLAACVALTPITSVYRWRGSLERASEVQLLIKTRADRLEELERTVHRLHSYDTPEWVHWPVRAGEGYGGWLQESCSP